MPKPLVAALALLLPALPAAVAAAPFSSYEECLVETLKTAPDCLSVSAVKKSCAEKTTPGKAEATVEAPQAKAENEPRKNNLEIAFHNPTYLLGSYNNNLNGTGLGFKNNDNEVDPGELKFQLSFKVPISPRWCLAEKDTGQFFAAYTAISFWQILNADISRPFRETNHEPEIFFDLTRNEEYFGFIKPSLRIGGSHQSNGRSGDVSRSWNRLYLDFILPKDEFTFHVMPWSRFKEKPDQYVGDPYGDDNPDILAYMGHGELRAEWRINARHTLDLKLRNHKEKGAIELDWTMALPWHVSEKSPFKGYIQYFSGYGESLIDYNSSVSRIGIGVRLTDPN